MSQVRITSTQKRTSFKFTCLGKPNKPCFPRDNHLRNGLVHEYDTIVDALVLDGARKAQTLFPKYVAAIEAYLKKKEG